MPDIFFFLTALLLPLTLASLAALCVILDARWRQGLLSACCLWIPCLGIFLWQSHGGSQSVTWNAHALPGIAVLPLALGGLLCLAVPYIPTSRHIFFIGSGIIGSALFTTCLYFMLSISDHAFTQFPLCLGSGLLFIWGMHAAPLNLTCTRTRNDETHETPPRATHFTIWLHLLLIPVILAPCILFTGNSSFAMAIGSIISPLLAICLLLLLSHKLTTQRLTLIFIAIPIALIVCRCILEESVTWVSLVLIGCAPWSMQILRISSNGNTNTNNININNKNKIYLLLSIVLALAAYIAAATPIASSYFAIEEDNTQTEYDYSY